MIISIRDRKHLLKVLRGLARRITNGCPIRPVDGVQLLQAISSAVRLDSCSSYPGLLSYHEHGLWENAERHLEYVTKVKAEDQAVALARPSRLRQPSGKAEGTPLRFDPFDEHPELRREKNLRSRLFTVYRSNGIAAAGDVCAALNRDFAGKEGTC